MANDEDYEQSSTIYDSLMSVVRLLPILYTMFCNSCPAMNFRRFNAISFSASCGRPPAACGLKMRFFCFHNGDDSCSGSFSNTSSAAPPISSASSAEFNAASSIQVPAQRN